MPVTPKLVIVDTNCYVRLYQSSVRPILNSVVGGYRLMTLTELRLEADMNSDVVARNPGMSAADIQAELTKACLKLREPKKESVRTGAKLMRKQGDEFLAKYCAEHKTDKVRSLSLADSRALSAVDVLGAALATDEWPLTEVAKTLSPDLELFTSVGLLFLMEKSGTLSAAQRHDTVRSWCVTGELLPRDWQDEYRALFGCEPPNAQSAQSANSHKA
jgi:hypothetical protein